LFEECGINKFGIKHNRLPRNFFRPLNSGDTQFVCPRCRELINNSLFNDDLLCILAQAEKEIAGFLIVACHHETAYDLHCCMQRVYEATLRPVQAAMFKATATLYQGTSQFRIFR
jgi:hypothetical protein